MYSGRSLIVRSGRRDLLEHGSKPALVVWVEGRQESLLGGRGGLQAIGKDAAAALGDGHDVAASIARIGPPLDEGPAFQRVDEVDHGGAVDPEALGRLEL